MLQEFPPENYVNWILKVNNSQITLLIALIIIDLILTSIRSSLLNVRFPRLVSLSEAGMVKVEKTMELVTKRARTRSTLKLGQALVRFMIAGLVLLNFVIPNLNEEFSILVMAYMLLIGLVLWLLEFILERLILKDPESWSVRFTPLASFLDRRLRAPSGRAEGNPHVRPVRGDPSAGELPDHAFFAAALSTVAAVQKQ